MCIKGTRGRVAIATSDRHSTAAIFQVVLTSTSRKTHAQECAKIILDNMGNNEEKTDVSLKWILIVLNRLHHDEKTQENTPFESFDGDISKCETLRDIHSTVVADLYSRPS